MALPFEKPIDELQARIDDMRSYSEQQEIDLSNEITLLEDRLERLKQETFADLSRWQRVQVARAPGRPTSLDYIQTMFEDFSELHGDRVLGDDPAVVTGIARFGGQSVVVVAQQKGRDTKENIHRNFGMSHPSGYRKAMRMFDLADKFNLPVLTFIDTPGAYPGIAAEEQGQAWVIAESIRRMSQLMVPAISVVIGEGGSGGALAIGVANRVLILENAIYSVISPESCAAILWRDASEAPKAAEALRLTAHDLLELDIVDGIIEEPNGGAHRDAATTIERVARRLELELDTLCALSPEALYDHRQNRFRRLGRVSLVERKALSADPATEPDSPDTALPDTTPDSSDDAGQDTSSGAAADERSEATTERTVSQE
ncbi:MAG: acetyl-CoA carboxylase carboxyltransferase subunit alpha [Trueperaceae bacterium]|nr:acetyl-CoA carboxylase carboxyltransferase subunit alpha [Trueperaceae bacterium]